eukprot:TRINITY_DN72_c0_g3_i1.p1 TRINITY_DN72_c0_g3~~TRINITY_DN72_c0_g3_i1.p1  ORF type:complete len:131 (-),score=48.62 TRINITY_DN72_c0_g3_i1:286-678(-)
MEEYKDSPNALITDVDCTAGGKELCEKFEVRGYPTIKYGDPTDMKDYQGGRSYEDLKKFADENLGPQCGPENLDLCSADVKAKIEGYMKMSASRLEGKVRNAQRILDEEVPFMKKVVAYLKKGGEAKSEL